MKEIPFFVATILLCGVLAGANSRRIAIEWREGRPQGELSVTGGSLAALSVTRGKGVVMGSNRFNAIADAPFRLEVQLSGSEVPYGPAAAIITVKIAGNPFSFFLRDVHAEQPVCIPAYGVAVADAADARSYRQIEEAVRARGLQTKLERVAAEPEESYREAAANTREVKCQTWLGLSRDIRIFGVSERLDWVQPRFHGNDVPLPETGNKPTRYNFLMGRGWGAVEKISRRLEDGVLPILQGTLIDDDITYNLSAFVTLESKPLNRENLRGTHFLVADGYGHGHMFTKEQRARHDALMGEEMSQPEETVLFMRMSAVNTARSERWRKEAADLKSDIRTALFEVMGRSPVIPLADGTWCPTAPPWVEYRGPLALYADGGNWFTHGAMVSRDSLLGPIYLIFQEVLDPNEHASTFLLNFHNDLMTSRNVAFSQPYYSRHPVSHLRRGEVKPFLKAYFGTMSALADRQTYTFWEHYFGASPHKTHEESWFLMDTRGMLYMERGSGIELLAGIPRAYLENGKRIELDKVATYFGPLSLRVDSAIDQGRVQATVECAGDRKPKFVELRIPHPQGRVAARVTGGTYDAATERVRIEPFDGRAEITVTFE